MEQKMKDIYRRYFRITEGPLVEEVKTATAINEQARAQYEEILKSIGAKTKEWIHRNDCIVGVCFEKAPDSSAWKKVKGFNAWWPKQNRKDGRELIKRFREVKPRNTKDCLKAINLNGNFPRIFGGNKCYYASITEIPTDPPVVFVVVPWFDVDPAELENYKANRDNGKRGDRDLDAILWEPTPEMVEVKHWQVEKEIEEYNASVRAAA